MTAIISSSRRPPRLPANVVAMGTVSLLNDASSEMIYPLLPLFLARTLGAGPVFLGSLGAAAGGRRGVSGA